MELKDFLHPTEQIRAGAQIDYEKGAKVLFGVTDKRCFVFEDTKRNQSFISGKEFLSIMIIKPKLNIMLVILGIIIGIGLAIGVHPVAFLGGLVIVLLAWILSKRMLVCANVGAVNLNYLIKKQDQINQMIQFMQFVHC